MLKTEYSNALSNYNSAKKNYDADSATLEKYVSSMNELTKGQSSLTKLIARLFATFKSYSAFEISTEPFLEAKV